MYLARTALIGDTFQIELEFRNVGFSTKPHHQLFEDRFALQSKCRAKSVPVTYF